MTKRDTCRFKRRLESMKLESVRALQGGQGRIVTLSADPMDQTRALADQVLDSRTTGLARARLRCLEDALRAIQEGHFGRCTCCGCDIPRKRLEAVPWSQFCVACQEIGELRGAGRGTQQLPMEDTHVRATWPGLNRVGISSHPAVLRSTLKSA